MSRDEFAEVMSLSDNRQGIISLRDKFCEREIHQGIIPSTDNFVKGRVREKNSWEFLKTNNFVIG